MNRRDFRKAQIDLREIEHQLFKERIVLEKQKLRAEIQAIEANTEKLKVELKNLYKACVEEVKKEKKEE